MIVGLATIQNSGSHLMHRMLSEHLKGISPNAVDCGEGFYFYHLLHSNRAWTQLDYPTISPMRHPVRILESHRRRGKTLEFMAEQFRTFQLLKDPIVIHVDRVDRDEYVKRAAKRLNMPLKTDWPLLSPKNTLGFKVTPERLAEIPTWIMDIYETTLAS